jgi:hypothetical protein
MKPSASAALARTTPHGPADKARTLETTCADNRNGFNWLFTPKDLWLSVYRHDVDEIFGRPDVALKECRSQSKSLISDYSVANFDITRIWNLSKGIPARASGVHG